jgi:predicted TIM-barrel fold metal-dependent hydrolase
MSTKNTIINCHAHCFTLDHAPDYFAKNYFPVKLSWLKRSRILNWFVRNAAGFMKESGDMLERLSNLLTYGNHPQQEDIIKKLLSYYPVGSKFVLLTMDMDYMAAGKPKKHYIQQLHELASVKQKEPFRDIIYPFIFADPRRIVEQPNYLAIMEEYIKSGVFQGIKFYPALGYWPFDKALRPVYEMALAYDVPLLYHCAKGIVHYRGKKQYTTHPFDDRLVLPSTKPKEFTAHFTHPVNFECLLNEDMLSRLWAISKAEASKFSRLKICIGHHGGDDEWDRYLQYPWYRDVARQDSQYQSLQPENWSFEIGPREGQYSWFSIICDLMKKYPNVYSDVSYTLYKDSCYPLLKVMLENDDDLSEKLLFGTDFYVVSKAASEREFSINLRGYLGEKLFWKLADKNPKRYLSNAVVKI